MAKRRGHGEGSITKRKDGRWHARIDLGWHGGKRQRKHIYGKTQAEVRRKLTQALRDKDRGRRIDTERMTLEQFAERWIESQKPRLQPKTIRSYADTMKLHILPTLGRLQLTEITPDDVERLMAQKADEGLSPRSVAYVRAVLRIALNRAVKWEYLDRNVAALTDPPKQPKKEREVFTAQEARRFLDAVKGDRLEALYTAVLALGLRQGEALGLRWSDVDLDEGTLNVTGALQRIDGKLQRKETKTERHRKLAIPSVAIASLRAHRVRQLEEKIAFGGEFTNEGDFVFVSEVGTPLDAGNVYKRFKRILKRAELPDQRFHDLRHACASLLAAQGVPARVLMEVLGHSQISTTLDIYQHLYDEAKQEAADRMDQALQRVN